jgi:hypothetical protein
MRAAMLSFEVFDVVSIAQGQCEFIHTFEQTFMPEGIHREYLRRI